MFCRVAKHLNHCVVLQKLAFLRFPIEILRRNACKCSALAHFRLNFYLNLSDVKSEKINGNVTDMDKEKVNEIIRVLSENFSDKPALVYENPFQLLIAVILSAQCTDERVNKVTAKLFKDYPTPESLASISQESLEKYIFSCGLYKTKARHIRSACHDIVEKYDGHVPDDLDSLRSLAGVGRKTANVVYSVAFGGNVIAVDTHVFRVSNRIGLARENNVLATEKALLKAIDGEKLKNAHHYLIYLGRSFCKARKPDCLNCPIEKLCEKNVKR